MGFLDFLTGKKDPDALPKNVDAARGIELVKEGATLVDVREPAEWKSGHAREAMHIPLGRIATSTGRLPKGKPVVVICRSGMRSMSGAAQLREAGFEATSLKGGMRAWQQAGGSFV